jgi:hypothetical protein
MYVEVKAMLIIDADNLDDAMDVITINAESEDASVALVDSTEIKSYKVTDSK